MSAKDFLIDAAENIEEEFGGHWKEHPNSRFMLSLARWFRAEADSHFHIGDHIKYAYDMPGMENSPAVITAKDYFYQQLREG